MIADEELMRGKENVNWVTELGEKSGKGNKIDVKNLINDVTTLQGKCVSSSVQHIWILLAVQ